jgi:excisionase family DNA binding protein
MKPLLTAKEIATFFKLSEKTIYKWAKENKIPHLNLEGSIRFKEEEVLQWSESKKVIAMDLSRETNSILRRINPSKLNVKSIVKNAIDEIQRKEYNSGNGKPASFRKKEGGY